MTTRTRRDFLREVAVGSAATVLAAHRSLFAMSHASLAAPWASQIGLELYTVRDLLAGDYEGTLAKVAAIGYTEVEPTSYNNLSSKDFRAPLDRYKLSVPSTHAPARGSGADLENQLEGFQIMGIGTTEIQAGGPGRGTGRSRSAATGNAPARRLLRRRHGARSQRLQRTGGIDFKPAFAQASLAGLKHFVIEQDNAAAWGDSLAAARVSFQNLKEMLVQN